MPETFDLDRALDDLTRDVTSRTHPAGAERAITTGRRRRASLGAVAAVGVLTVGGLVVSQLAGPDEAAPQPTGPVRLEDRLPEPADLTVQRLAEATDGWQSDWRAGTSPRVLNDPVCLDGSGTESLAVVSLDSSDFVSGSSVAASVFSSRMPDGTTGAEVFDLLAASIDACGRRGTVTDYSLPEGSRARVSRWEAVGDKPSSTLWVVQAGQAIDLAIVTGATRAPSPEVEQDMALAVLGDLLHDDVEPGPEESSMPAPSSAP